MSTRSPRWGLAMGLYLLGIFMGAIDTGIVTPGRTIIANDLGVDEQVGIWMITVYTLAYAASIPVLGKLADRLGRKPVYLSAIALFGVGSLLCGLAQDVGSFGMLIAARAVQAIGGGGILPIATAAIGTEVPKEKRGLALGLVGAVFGIANLLGASAGSLILDLVGTHNWQWIFYVNVPIAVLIVVAGLVLLPDHTETRVAPLDLTGTTLMVAMIMSLLYGLTNVDFFDLAGSLSSTDVYPFLLAFVLLLPLFVLAERRAADPVLNLGYFTDRPIALTLAASFLSGFVLMGVVFVPQFAENALRLPSGSGGYLVIILGLASGVGAPLSGRLTDAVGPKRVLALGAAISMVAAVSVLAWAIPYPSFPAVIVTLVLIGLGLGFVIGSPLNYLMLKLAPAGQSNSALGTLSLLRSIGTTIAPAIMVGLLAHSGTLLQDRLTADLPSTVQAPELPYAAALQKQFDDWKADDRFADALKEVTFPDLTSKTTITIDTTAGGDLPPDLVDLVRTADVTTIVERTKTVAGRIFAAQTPAVIADITTGVDTGIGQLRTVDGTLHKTRSKMTEGIDTTTTGLERLRAALTRMDRSVNSLGSAITEQGRGIAGMTKGIDGMTRAVAGLTKARAGQARAIDGMSKGLGGLSRALAGVTKAIAGIDAGLAGTDAAIAGQRDALAQLAAKNDPALQPQIERLTAAIATLETKRAELLKQREPLAAKRGDLQQQRSALTAKRADLVQARATLSVKRAAVIGQRAKLAGQRAQLSAARDKLVKARDGLLRARTELATSRAKLAKARVELVEAREGIDKARAEVAETVRELRVLRQAVPGAFDQARVDYLAAIDARGPQLTLTFQRTLGEGFRDVYLLYGAACLLLLGLLPLIRVPGEEDEREKADAGTS